MNQSIANSKEALGKSMENVEATYSTFDQISDAVGGAEEVQRQMNWGQPRALCLRIWTICLRRLNQ